MSTSTPNSAQDLQRAYIWSINNALENGGVDLAAELAANYERESSALTEKLLACSAA
jgi:hypothetical protein